MTAQADATELLLIFSLHSHNVANCTISAENQLPIHLNFDYIYSLFRRYDFAWRSMWYECQDENVQRFANILQLSLRGTHLHGDCCKMSYQRYDKQCINASFFYSFFVSFDCRDLSCKFVLAAISRQ